MFSSRIRAAFVAAPLVLAAVPALADTWTVTPNDSTLAFSVQQGDGVLTGSFATWTASIEFDPAAPEAAVISALIETGSAVTGNSQFTTMLPTEPWFDTNQFAQANFTSTNVRHLDGNAYEADGSLTLRGLEQPVTLAFTLDIDGDTAKVSGTATVKRSDYKLGDGIGTDSVADAVTVNLDLTAVR